MKKFLGKALTNQHNKLWLLVDLYLVLENFWVIFGTYIYQITGWDPKTHPDPSLSPPLLQSKAQVWHFFGSIPLWIILNVFQCFHSSWSLVWQKAASCQHWTLSRPLKHWGHFPIVVWESLASFEMSLFEQSIAYTSIWDIEGGGGLDSGP